MTPKRLAVILARGGSKRLPGKNLKILGGQPLLGWVLGAAIASQCFSRVVVSTDCPEIAAVAKQLGGDVPFLRPPELASDEATSLDALLHAVSILERVPDTVNAAAAAPAVAATAPAAAAPAAAAPAVAATAPAAAAAGEAPGTAPDTKVNEKYDAVALLQPTSPFVTATQIRAACQLMDEQNFTSVETMCAVTERPEWMFRRSANGKTVSCDQQHLLSPISQLEPLFRETGALYLVRRDFLLAQRSLYCLDNHGSIVLPWESSIDIDTQHDWHLAEYILARGLVR